MDNPLPGVRPLASALRRLSSGQEVDETLQLAVDLAADVVPGCDGADVMFLGPGGTFTPVSSDALAVAIDRVQGEVGEGPCISAARGQAVVVANELLQDTRWPAFSKGVAGLGVHSMVSYQLFLPHRDDRFGALNLFGTRADAFDDDAVALGEVFAAHCSAVLAAAIDREGLRAALESRDLIGQAKGILMQRHQLTAADAFDALRRASQARNVKLRDLARSVVESGALD